jgi:hypothetical protein
MLDSSLFIPHRDGPILEQFYLIGSDSGCHIFTAG